MLSLPVKVSGMLVICFVTASLAFQTHWTSPVKGSIIPANGGIRAWLFSRTDTVSAPVLQGNFLIEQVKPGNYTLMIEGIPPYQNAMKPGIIVTEGEVTDVGIIQMNR